MLDADVRVMVKAYCLLYHLVCQIDIYDDATKQVRNDPIT